MLPSKNRLRKKEIKKILKKGKKIHSQNFLLFFLKNDLKYSRFSVIVPLKFSKKAVERNKIKRKVREVLRRFFLNRFLLNFSFDGVFIIKEGAKKLNFWQIKKEIEKIFKKICLKH